MLVEARVQSLGLDRATNTPVVILQELEGERVLPIWIGPGEASAIAMELAEMSFSRPLTHDLLVAVMRGLGGDLESVIITRVSDATYYAELQIRAGDEVVKVDARPSDSIAVALRTGARILASDELLEIASIEISDEELDPAPEAGEGREDAPFMNAEELKEYLKKLNPEDFGRFTP